MIEHIEYNHLLNKANDMKEDNKVEPVAVEVEVDVEKAIIDLDICSQESSAFTTDRNNPIFSFEEIIEIAKKLKSQSLPVSKQASDNNIPILGTVTSDAGLPYRTIDNKVEPVAVEEKTAEEILIKYNSTVNKYGNYCYDTKDLVAAMEEYKSQSLPVDDKPYGWVFEGRFFKEENDMRGLTMSEGNVPVAVYASPVEDKISLRQKVAELNATRDSYYELNRTLEKREKGDLITSVELSPLKYQIRIPELVSEKDKISKAIEWVQKIEMKSFHKNEWTEMEEINQLAKSALQSLK